MIFELDPTRRIKLDELRQRILNCHQFTKPQLLAPIYSNPPPYEESLPSTRSDENSMISDYSDDSTVPREVHASYQDDFSSFEGMGVLCHFNLDQGLQGPASDVAPALNATPKVWDAASIVSLEDSIESSLNTKLNVATPSSGGLSHHNVLGPWQDACDSSLLDISLPPKSSVGMQHVTVRVTQAGKFNTTHLRDAVEPITGYESLLQSRPHHRSHRDGRALTQTSCRASTHHRFICTFQTCSKTFRRYGDLTRHFKKHFTCLRAFHCSHLGCDRNGEKGFYRKDKLLDHQKKKHGL